MRTGLTIIFVTVGAVACGPRSTYPTPLGAYHVMERVLQTTPPVTIEGTITLRPDTLLIDMTPGPCRAMESSPQAYNFQCANEVRLWFDRRDPVQRNSYSVTTTETISKRRCGSYAKDTSGNERCVRYDTEVVEQKATRVGRLRPQRP